MYTCRDTPSRLHALTSGTVPLPSWKAKDDSLVVDDLSSLGRPSCMCWAMLFVRLGLKAMGSKGLVFNIGF